MMRCRSAPFCRPLPCSSLVLWVLFVGVSAPCLLSLALFCSELADLPRLTGTIPEAFKQFRRLTNLRLERTGLSGARPAAAPGRPLPCMH